MPTMRLLHYTRTCLLIFAIALASYGAHADPHQGEGGSAHPRDQNFHSPSLTVAPIRLELPYPADQTYEVLQGNHGTFTHSDFNRFAWDFAMPEGAPVAAAAGGRVVRIKQDSDKGGVGTEFWNDGNVIILDHGKGYFTQYLHLKKDSARVREGDIVSGGQIIAESGNTGFSSTPHLHFHVHDATGHSLPARFVDVAGDGIPREGQSYTSGNDGLGSAAYSGESSLPLNAFALNSIELENTNLPGHLLDCGRIYTLRGRLLEQSSKVALFVMSPNGGRALYSTFAPVADDGSFQLQFTAAAIKLRSGHWSNDPSLSNPFCLAVAPVKEDGSFWSDVSIPVCFR